MLAGAEKAKPPNPKPPKDRRSPTSTDDPPTLASIDISKNTSSRAQYLAKATDAEFEAALTVPAGKELNHCATR
jgi:hypothetical protein